MGIYYVVEYSVSQKCWSITTVDNALQTNLDMVLRKESNDYKIIAITRTHDEASRIYNELKDRL